MSASVNLVWFRDDLRTADHPALAAAAAADGPVVCVYVLEEGAGLRPLGGAARWWLHHSLTALDEGLRTLGAPLVLRRGDPRRVLPALAEETQAVRVFWSRRYAPAEVALDARVKTTLEERGLRVESFNANLLHEPWTVTTKAGEPFRVFTPFWRAARAKGEPDAPGPAPARLDGPAETPASEALSDWTLRPRGPNWAREFSAHWTPGEAGAQARLDAFLETGLRGYAAARDRPEGATTSRLSPHLRWGEISPRQIWATVQARAGLDGGNDAEKFFAELGWREFSKSLLFHADDLAERNWRPAFDAFPWRDDPDGFAAWSRGRTGYPFVDAGMRQLWRTGWMHNRVRMVAASFLIKHMLINWREGERWFWDTLVDADAASNPASWQWVAGSGADAAPFFRIFNPVAQAEKFDPDGAYVRRWIPELAAGAAYPAPIVDHAAARERALAAFATLGGS